MNLPFWKTGALGNDFVLIHPTDLDLPRLAQRVCDRHTGVGADGLLVIGPDLVLRMFNPDGTEDFCGNGLRCAAWHVDSQGWAKESFVLNHRGIEVPSTIHKDGRVSVELGTPTFDPADVPLDTSLYPNELWMEQLEGITACSVSTGTTHTILLVDELPRDEVFFRISPVIEHHPFFPERTSVIWTVRSGPHQARLRIWERGAGETLACGSGNVAVACVLARLDGHGGGFTLLNPGGQAQVTIQDQLKHPVITSGVHVPFQGRIVLP